MNTIKREKATGRHVPCRVILDKYRKCVFTTNAIKKIMGKDVTLNVYAAANNLSLVNIVNLEKYMNHDLYRYFYSNKQLIANMKHDLLFPTVSGGVTEALQENYDAAVIAEGNRWLSKWCPGDTFHHIRAAAIERHTR